MKNEPVKIWLQVGDVDHNFDEFGGEGVTWCWHEIYNTDIVYLRAETVKQVIRDMGKDYLASFMRRINAKEKKDAKRRTNDD